MAFGVFMRISGPDHHGEFVAILPDAETRIVTCWDDLAALRHASGMGDRHGDALALHGVPLGGGMAAKSAQMP